MVTTRRMLLAAASAGLVAACAPRSKFRTYEGPEVTGIVVAKSDRRMYLVHDGRVLETYRIDLGQAPAGPKRFEGDGRTPEGTYVIDRRNPASRYHLSLGISYPNPSDRAFAAAAGRSPGGDIFIHGRSGQGGRPDWTAGCIAVSDRAIEEIYAMVREGTPITIHP